MFTPIGVLGLKNRPTTKPIWCIVMVMFYIYGGMFIFTKLRGPAHPSFKSIISKLTVVKLMPLTTPYHCQSLFEEADEWLGVSRRLTKRSPHPWIEPLPVTEDAVGIIKDVLSYSSGWGNSPGKIILGIEDVMFRHKYKIGSTRLTTLEDLIIDGLEVLREWPHY